MHTRFPKKKGIWQRGRSELRPSGLLLIVGAVSLAVGLAAAVVLQIAQTGTVPRAYALAPESVLPADIRQAPPSVQEAYRFAVANREVLRWIPCYCGCGLQGHTSNASCYIKDASPPGVLLFDRMSFG